MKIESAGKTDVGKSRSNNQDSLAISDSISLYVVADGMGGHSGGERASKLTVDTVSEYLERKLKDKNLNIEQTIEEIGKGISLANTKVREEAKINAELNGMGTTLVSLHIYENEEQKREAIIANVGDSRAYLIRNRKIEQITEDHSLLNEQIKGGLLKPEDSADFPYRNVITRAIGIKENEEADFIRRPVEPNDIFLLCSDGLHGLVSDSEMMEIVDKNQPNLEKACKTLIDMANDKGGSDNITVILVWVGDQSKKKKWFSFG